MSIFDKIKSALGSKDGDSSAPGEMQSASDQPSEDRELVSFVKKKFEEVRSHANRISHEGIWMTNIAYMLGFDSVYYDPTLKQFRPAGRSPQFVKRNRIHSNLILPAVQNRLARMLKNPPQYDVRPDSMDEEDKDAARLGIEIINMVWDKQAINRKRIDLGMWLQECGHAFVKVSWDDGLGEPLVDPATDELIGFEGDIRIDVCSAFECFADPLAKTFEDCAWFGQAKVRKLDYFRQHYPERGELVKEEGAWLLSAQYEMRINSLNSVGPSSSGTTEQMKNAAIELSFYEKKSKKHPKGRHIVVANGVMLKNDDLPCGEIPFAKFDDVVVGGKFYSESLVTHARPLQDQYNRTLVKRSDWVNKLLAGKYMAAKGHGIMQEAFTDQSGEIVEYDVVPGAAPPQAIQMPVIPQYAYTESDKVKSEMYEIFGLSDVSRGQLPSASIPAAGIQILLEQDETRIGIETEQHEYAWARVGQLILKFAEECYVTERKLKSKSKNSQYEVKSFTGDQLKGNTDAIVIRGSTVPNVKAMRRQEILNLMGQGLLGDPKNDPAAREQILGALEYGELGKVWEDYHVDMEQITQSIKMIEQGQPPEVNLLDNHQLHCIIKNRYRKTKKFQSLPLMSQDLLEQDMENHKDCALRLQHPELFPKDDGQPPPEVMKAIIQQQHQEFMAKNPMPPGMMPPGPMGPSPMGGPGMPGQSPGGAPPGIANPAPQPQNNNIGRPQ